MAAELVFYTNPMSRGRIVRWMLEEVGAPYHTEVLDYEAMQSADYLAINPMGKVPAITHGGAVVTECAAICAYLADAFPEAGLIPPPGPARAAYYRWLFYAAGPVEAAITNKALGVEVPPEREQMVGYRNMDAVVAALETAVQSGPYICGEQFTAADVYVGSQLIWGMLFGSLPKTPAFEAYSERVKSRPAAARAREIDDALLPEDKRGMM